MVDNCDYSAPASKTRLERMQEIWASYKTKPFVLLGNDLSDLGAESGEGEDERPRKYKSPIVKVGYPVYNGIGLLGYSNLPLTNRFWVVDAASHLLYCGEDERRATELAVIALTDERVPPTSKAYEALLAFELEELPGKALARIAEFRKHFPEKAASYDERYVELKAREAVVRLAKLEALARQVKDYNPKARKGPRFNRNQVSGLINQYEDLKRDSDPKVVQEAKNCLADLKWAAAAMK